MKKKKRPLPGAINHFKAQCRACAARRDMNLADLAKAVGWTSAGLASILNRATPTPQNVEIIARALGVSPERLMSPITPTEWFVTVPRHD